MKHHRSRTSRLVRLAPAFLALAAFAQEPPPRPEAEPPTEAGPPTGAGPPPQTEQPARGLIFSAEGACEGFTLFAPLRSKTTWLVDMHGEAVHRWESEHTPGNSVYLMDDGSILRCARSGRNAVFSAGGEGGRVQRIAWDGTLLWDFEWSNDQRRQHHDIEPLPNGNVLLISWEYVSAEEAIAAGRDPAQVGERGLWPDAIIEIEPEPPTGGKVVWKWRAWDHLIQDHDPERAHYGDVTAHPERLDVNVDHRRAAPMSAEMRRQQAERERQMRDLGYAGDDEEEEEKEDDDEGRRRSRLGGDWLHLNSVAYQPELELLIVSSPTLSEIWVIDHSTTTAQAAGRSGGRWGRGGDLLYRWGNPRNYGARGARMLFRQHDARWLEDDGSGSLRVLVFNNGQERSGSEWSSVDELELPFDPERGFLREPGHAYGPAAPSWSYSAPEKEDFYASFISGAERLPNGNTLICSGPQGRLFEVTRAGEIVWDYLMPFPGEEQRDEARDREPDGRPVGGPAGDGGASTAPDREPPAAPRRDMTYALFRATRIAPDHPGLAGRGLAPR